MIILKAEEDQNARVVIQQVRPEGVGLVLVQLEDWKHLSSYAIKIKEKVNIGAMLSLNSITSHRNIP